MEKSEFIARDNIQAHILDGKPSANIEGAKEVLIAKGENIPKFLIPNFIRYNRDFIANLPMKDGRPVLTETQEKEYGLKFEVPEPKTFRNVIDKMMGKYTLETLKQKVAKKGAVAFKDWAETEFGKDKIDKRKSADHIITHILEMQEAD